MRTTLFIIASGFALSLSTIAGADVMTPEPQHVATVMPAVATTPEEARKVTCHHLVHEGSLSPIVQCGTSATWNHTRQETEHTLWEIQVRSFSRPR